MYNVGRHRAPAGRIRPLVNQPKQADQRLPSFGNKLTTPYITFIGQLRLKH